MDARLLGSLRAFAAYQLAQGVQGRKLARCRVVGVAMSYLSRGGGGLSRRQREGPGGALARE